MSERMRYREARYRALARALDADPSIFLVGGSVAVPFNPDDGLLERYAERILRPPISEFAIAGVGIGAAMSGLRPFVPLSTASFMFYAWAPIVNEAPNVRYLSGGATGAPVVFHVMGGSRRGGGPQHEHTPQAMLQNVPGLRVYAPGTPAEIDAVLHEALTGPDPAVIVDHVLLAEAEGAVTPSPAPVAPQLVREGGDVLIVASSLMTQRALAAAAHVAGEGIGCAVLSVPRIAPLPNDEIAAAASGYQRVVFADESRAAGSPSSHAIARLVERRPGLRVRLECTGDAPAPFATHLLDELVPTGERLAAAVSELAHG